MKLAKIAKWIAIVVAAIVVISIALIFIFPQSLTGPTAPPLQLPTLNTSTTSATLGSPDGTWQVGNGSIAGFRVEESFLVQSGTIVGRSSAVTGSLAISNNQITSGSFQVDLSKLTLGAKQNASFFKLMDTDKYPSATLTLTAPTIFADTPTNGQTITATATGTLSMHGITRPVTFTFTGRYDGSVLEAIGSAPVLASDWSIDSPFGIHNNDMIEFLVVLQRA